MIYNQVLEILLFGLNKHGRSGTEVQKTRGMNITVDSSFPDRVLVVRSIFPRPLACDSTVLMRPRGISTIYGAFFFAA